MLPCSVLVAAHNVEGFIGPALVSALDQTYPAVEVIVVNDGSTDGTASAIRRFLDRIRYLEQPNRGLAAARNRGLREAGGAYIALLDGDDVWMPTRLERVIGFLEEHPDIGFATTDAYFLEEGGPESVRYYGELPGGFPVKDQASRILEHNFIMGMAVVRRELFEAHGTFDESLRTSEDWDLWIRFLVSGERAGLVDEPLAYYRRRPGTLSRDTGQILRDALAIVERAVDLPGAAGIPRLGTVLYRRGLQALALGDLRRARRFLAIAARDRTAPAALRARALLLATMPGLGRRLYRRRRPEPFQAIASAARRHP